MSRWVSLPLRLNKDCQVEVEGALVFAFCIAMRLQESFLCSQQAIQVLENILLRDGKRKSEWNSAHRLLCHSTSVFQPFSIHGTFEALLSLWHNLDTQNSTNLRILTEHSKEWAKPLGYAEPRLKKGPVEKHCTKLAKTPFERSLGINLWSIL